MYVERSETPRSAVEALDPRSLHAARVFVDRVLHEVPAVAVQASLFGSRARGEADFDSDVDVLFVFRDLPLDREPHAGHAEAIAEQVADATGVPVTVWSIALSDLRRGRRTPMLVDALEDALPLWCAAHPIAPVAFTPDDAVHCCSALLDRISEGGEEYAGHLQAGDAPAAAKRARDDILRVCTGLLLLRGITRPRRAEAIHTALGMGLLGDPPEPRLLPVLDWAARSYGPRGKDDERPPPPPPVRPATLASILDDLRQRLVGGLVRRHPSCTAGSRSRGLPMRR